MTLGPRDAVLVFTHDPKLDVPAVQAALAPAPATSARSAAAARRRTATSGCARPGVTDEALARVHAPCGLDIGSSTVEETAVAILGEIIADRTGRAGRAAARGLGADPARAGGIRRGARGFLTVGSPPMAAMKWWGWGDEAIAFTRRGQAGARPRSSRSTSGSTSRRSTARPVAFADLDVPAPSLPGVLRAALEEAVGAGFVSADALDRVVHARGKSLRDLVLPAPRRARPAARRRSCAPAPRTRSRRCSPRRSRPTRS